MLRSSVGGGERDTPRLPVWTPDTLGTRRVSWHLDLSRSRDSNASHLLSELERQLIALDVDILNRRPSEADALLAREFGPPICLETIRARLVEFLLHGPGFVVVKLGTPTPSSLARILYRHLLIGYALGMNRNRYAADQPPRALFEISPRSAQRYAGNGENAKTIGLHTDGSGVVEEFDILCLSCIAQTPGPTGATLISNASAAVERLPTTEQRLLASLWPRTSPYDVHTPVSEFVRRPIAMGGKTFEFSYHPDRVRDALDACNETTIARLRVLASLDMALLNLAVPVKLAAGEMLLLNNRTLAHGRVGFAPDADQRRVLMRQWLQLHERTVAERPPSQRDRLPISR